MCKAAFACYQRWRKSLSKAQLAELKEQRRQRTLANQAKRKKTPKAKAAAAAYYQANREEILAKQKSKYAADREARLEINRAKHAAYMQDPVKLEKYRKRKRVSSRNQYRKQHEGRSDLCELTGLVCSGSLGIRDHMRLGEPLCGNCAEWAMLKSLRMALMRLLESAKRERIEAQKWADGTYVGWCETYGVPITPAGGYMRHYYKGEEACATCKAAISEHTGKQYKIRGGSKPRRKAPLLAARDGGWWCSYCGCDVEDDYQVDHVHPVSRASEYEGVDINELSNLVLACPSCNISKSNYLLSEWI